MRVNRSCRTCEFNFNGVCAGHGCIYNYGQDIINESLTGEGWSIGLDYFTEIQKEAPWYIKEKFDKCKISMNEFLNEMEKYYNNEPIIINIYGIIERVYNINIIELSEILGVSVGVVNYARNRGTIPKRAKEFSRKLYIPIKYFEEITQLDIPEIERCKSKYDSLYK